MAPTVSTDRLKSTFDTIDSMRETIETCNESVRNSCTDEHLAMMALSTHSRTVLHDASNVLEYYRFGPDSIGVMIDKIKHINDEMSKTLLTQLQHKAESLQQNLDTTTNRIIDQIISHDRNAVDIEPIPDTNIEQVIDNTVDHDDDTFEWEQSSSSDIENAHPVVTVIDPLMDDDVISADNELVDPSADMFDVDVDVDEPWEQLTLEEALNDAVLVYH